MSERQFSEEEVAAIFKQASEAENLSAVSGGKGMTLAALQEIGREAGMSPEAIARAAASLDQTTRPQPQPQTLLGLPIAVGQTIEIDRPFTDADWESLVADLRTTFNARGVIRQDGRFRQWTNGNLQALVEPTPAGFRLRVRTMNGNLRRLTVMGLAFFGIGAATFVSSAVAGTLGVPGDVAGMGLLGLSGAGMVAFAALQLPGWARQRKAQMQEITSRVSVTGTLPPGAPPGPGRIPN